MVVIHVGAGVQRTQRPIQGERGLGVALLDALPHLHLHEVAPGNQILGALHRSNVVGLGKVTLGWISLRGLDDGCTHRVLELLPQIPQALFGVRIGLGLTRVGIDDEVKLTRQVVDHRQLFTLQQQDVRATQRVGWTGFFELFLDVTHGVIPKIPGQATTKARQSRAQSHLEALLIVRNEIQRIQAGSLDHFAVFYHLGHGFSAESTSPHQRAGWQPDEAVAAKPLTTDNGFQQKAVFTAVFGKRQLQVQGQGRFQVRKSFRHQRNAVKALRTQAFEFKFGNQGKSLHSLTPLLQGVHSFQCPGLGREARGGAKASTGANQPHTTDG